MSDEERQAAIDALPDAPVEIVFNDGTTATVDFKALAQQQEDEWRVMRENPMIKDMLAGPLLMEDE